MVIRAKLNYHDYDFGLTIKGAQKGLYYTIELVSLRRRALHDGINVMHFAFYIKYHFNVII
jgi:hypothetical protein